jgi:DNA-binding CsgD family transcriptional regulator
MNEQRRDSPVNRLSHREREILALMAQGRSNIGIANQLGISERTVESASAQLFGELDLTPVRPSSRRENRLPGGHDVRWSWASRTERVGGWVIGESGSESGTARLVGCRGAVTDVAGTAAGVLW